MARLKVLLINNYPMDIAWMLWKKSEYPGHHLWGATNLSQYGVELDILPHEKYPILNRLGKRIKIGKFLDQQLRVLFRCSQYDLIYSACQNNTLVLAFLRYIGILRKPIVVIIHHPPINTSRRFKKVFGFGHDIFLSLSAKCVEYIKNEYSINDDKVKLIEWGVELPFYEDQGSNPYELDPEFIISAGKTNRDYDTLIQAFKNIDYHLKIYCSGQSAPKSLDIPSNVEVIFNHPRNGALSYRDLLAEYRRAYAIAIPLNDTVSLTGLTSLLDAMAVGKPVIMTKNNFIDIDIEKEGIGIWAKTGDIAGWKQGLEYLLSNPRESREMGKRGHHLCKTKYNIEAFSLNLARIFRSNVRS